MSILEKVVLNRWFIVGTAITNAVFAETLVLWKNIDLHIGTLVALVILLNSIYWYLIIRQIARTKKSLTGVEAARQWKIFFWLLLAPSLVFAFAVLKAGFYYFFLALASLLIYLWVVGIAYSQQDNAKKQEVNKRGVDKIKDLTCNKAWMIFGAILMIGVLVRIYFIYNGQLDGDEGNYLYDAKLVLDGLVPKVDFAARGVAYVVVLAGWLKMVGTETILAARAFHVLAFALSLLGLFLVCKKVWNSKIALVVASAFAINPFSAYLGTILKTESMQELLHIWLVLAAVYLYFDRKKRYIVLLLLFGGIDIIVRPSSIIFFFFVCGCLVLLYLIKKFPYLVNVKNLAIGCAYSLIFGIPIISILLSNSDYLQRIFPKLLYLSNFNILKFASSLNSTISFLSGITGKILFVEILIFIGLSAVLLGALVRYRFLRYATWGIFFFWIAVAAGYFYRSLALYGNMDFLYIIIITLSLLGYIILVILIESQGLNLINDRRSSSLLILIFTYLFTLLAFYFLFLRFHTGYTYEFLLPLHIIGGYAVYHLAKNKMTKVVTYALCFLSVAISASIFTGSYSNQNIIVNYHFRRHSVAAVYSVTDFIMKTVPSEQEIFSGNTLFASNSDRRLVMNISHPQYDYHDYPTKKKERELLKYLKDNNVQYAVYDYKMEYFYYENNKKLRNFLTKSFYPIYTDAENNILVLKKLP